MRRILVAAACVLGLGLTVESASAHPGSPAAPVAYHRGHGVRFSGGYYYSHRDSRWSDRCWDSVHRRYHYYDPTVRVYYWWCPERSCYYPDSYCPPIASPVPAPSPYPPPYYR